MGIFDIIGPVMIGPSSSHTAGAVRLARLARSVLGADPVRARIGLHGSFARTYRGHGTDKALAGGLLGFDPDDERIVEALDVARRSGLSLEFAAVELADAHPNTAVIEMTDAGGRTMKVTGSSVGAGRVVLTRIDDYQVELTGIYHTLLVAHKDQPGMVSRVTGLLALAEVNIAAMRVSRRDRGAQALTLIETDQAVRGDVLGAIAGLPQVDWALMVPPI